MSFFFELYGDHRDLHVLTHSFPTRRSSDLPSMVSSNTIGELALMRFSVTQLFSTNSSPNSSFAMAIVSSARSGAVTEPMRSEEHTSELQSLMRISYAVFCLKTPQPYLNMHQLKYLLTNHPSNTLPT